MTKYTVPTTMRALTLSGKGFNHLAVSRVATPKPGPQQLLARVDAAGICTSLIKLVEQGSDHSYLYGLDPAKHPLILGDEGSVTLVKVGETLQNDYKTGERFVVQPAVDTSPVNGLERYRDNGKGIFKLAVGYSLPGHLAEYILIGEEILNAGCLLPLPSTDIASSHAAMSEPVSCAVSGQEHHVHLNQATPLERRVATNGLKPGGTAVIIGAGAMGRMHVDVALSYRPKHVVVTDFIAERLVKTQTLFGSKAEQLGITLHTLNGNDEVAGYISKLTEGHGADDVIVAVGAAKAIETAQHYTARGGVLNLFGGMRKGNETVQLDGNRVHYKETIVTGSSGGSPWDIKRTLELMAANELETSAHITRIGDLNHAPTLIELVKAQQLDGKAVVYPHRHSDTILEVEQWTAYDEVAYLG